MKVFILVSLAVVTLTAFANAGIASNPQWEDFKVKYGKSYSGSEEMIRKNIFKKNVKMINAHNALFKQGKKTFTLAVNKFADMHPIEYRRMVQGLRFTPSRLNMTEKLPASSVSDLPASVDWRTKGVVTPIKDQGECVSCWAFSVVASLEGQHALATGNLTSLSEQNLVDCSQAEGNVGCHGGMPEYAYQYIKDNQGLDTEASYPYENALQHCQFKRGNVGATLTSWVDLPFRDENALQVAVATIGPIAAVIDSSSGVYMDEDCSSYYPTHGVAVVGYDVLDNLPYWTVKNSWGEDWGQDGYILMGRNFDNQCGIATAASYPVV